MHIKLQCTWKVTKIIKMKLKSFSTHIIGRKNRRMMKNSLIVLKEKKGNLYKNAIRREPFQRFLLN